MTTIYPHVGTTTYATGERGTITGTSRTHAFIRTEAGEMWAVLLGGWVITCTCGRPSLGLTGHHEHCDIARNNESQREVTDARPVTLEEFDEITGLAEVRRDMGWAA